MVSSHVSAALGAVRGNRAAGKTRGKQQSAPNWKQQQPKHRGRRQARQRPGQRCRPKRSNIKNSVRGEDGSLSEWMPTESPSRQWGMVWPSTETNELSPSNAQEGRRHPDEQLLTQSMRNAESLDQLLNVIIKNGEFFNHVHTTAALRFLHSKLQWSKSKDMQPTYSVKMAESQSSHHSSPLLGGEPMCMYIGDVSEPPMPQHGPVTWDSHTDPVANSTPSTDELYSHGMATKAVQGVFGFPPVGSLPGTPFLFFLMLGLSSFDAWAPFSCFCFHVFGTFLLFCEKHLRQ